VYQSVAQAVHCINPHCPRPFPQPWGNKFCNGCGTSLVLNDRYISLDRLGAGGFATIYTVWDLQKQTQRVLKVLTETTPKALQLFEQEAAVLARLDHPGIPHVEQGSYFFINLASDQNRALPCLVMEKINGQTLQDVLQQHPSGCAELAVQDWLIQAVEILRVLHRSGIIHRDLKPSNLMLREGTGQLVAIDFGGAKQIGTMPFAGQISTRLISPGYSPPEQITGESVGPAADFYALGRTMIQLLTGQELADLQDPVTGVFRWRNQVNVSGNLANLLDEMVRIDAQQRPATAEEIQQRLAKSITKQPQASMPLTEEMAVALDEGIEAANQAIAKRCRQGQIASLGGGVAVGVRFVFRAITKVVLACLDTTWEIILGGIGAGLGAAAGFGLINWTIIGDRFAAWLAYQIPLILPGIEITAWRECLLFAIAGWGTAWGLTLAGGFGQRRRPIIAGITGTFGYSVAWLIWQTSVATAPASRLLGVITAVAVVPLVLGLGLPSHYLVHALVAALGTGAIFSSLVSLNFIPASTLITLFSRSDASLLLLIESIAFFGLIGISLGLCLGVSYYLIVPVLRWFGWR
jgi:predicted Ser/Thr protein kinase